VCVVPVGEEGGDGGGDGGDLCVCDCGCEGDGEGLLSVDDPGEFGDLFFKNVCVCVLEREREYGDVIKKEEGFRLIYDVCVCEIE
jgi:hypothetical protein